MTPQELGPYLLLRKLSENALCETYRAGQRSGQEVERVVLLYFFNCDPDDALWISETAQAGRRALAGLESPSLSAAIDSGEIAGTAYLTYDYIPGRSLEVVLEKARRLETAIPIEHALLITDRVAQGLQAAWDHESRALHGFVVPHLVMLSNEGDVQLLGLEVASRLRKLLADAEIQEQMGRYLAPEVVPEGQPSTTDDVFSLGALLFELVTGQVLPDDTDDLGEAVAEARTLDGEALPAPIVDLLLNSLTTSFGRSDLKTWRSGLSALLTSGEYDGNAFNLALFLHTLFGDEIESEADEALGEDSALGVVDTELEEASISTPGETVQEDHFETDAEESPGLEEIPPALVGEETGSTSGRGRFLGIAAGILVVLAAGFGAFEFFGPSDGSTEVALQPTESTPLTAPAATQPVGASIPEVDHEAESATEETEAPSPEEIDRRVQELLSQRSADMESSLRQEFESELAALREQVRQAEERTTSQPEAPLQADAQTEELTEGDAEALRLASTANFDGFQGSGVEEANASIPEESAALGSAEPMADTEPAATTVREPEPITLEERTGIETTDLLDSESGTVEPFSAEPQAESSPPEPEPGSEVVEPEPEPERPAETPEQSALPPAAFDPTPSVQAGDLVTPGPGVTHPSILSPAQPVYPMMARRLRKSAVVTVKVLVDENGHVTEAERLGDEAGYGFDAAAVQAALETRFEPATKEGVPVKIWWTVRIAFQP